ncbi:MAG: glycosyltransferase family 2 protein [Parabacteroides sp.]|nr:glycosyltransferase family 2 protein [Parabacteroides sp.]
METNNSLFSILIPTWNNLGYLRLCLESIRKNSTYTHQILIHVNEGSDGTLEWVKQSGYKYNYSKENIGVCWALNGLRSLVKTEYILYMNDDMYVRAGTKCYGRKLKSYPILIFSCRQHCFNPVLSFAKA